MRSTSKGIEDFDLTGALMLVKHLLLAKEGVYIAQSKKRRTLLSTRYLRLLNSDQIEMKNSEQ
jgi:hypothetical protein